MFVIESAKSWGVYRSSWLKCMGSTPWFNTNRILDYNKEEELEELEEDFQKNNVFLLAKSENNGKFIGVLGIILEGKTGRLRVWEPAVLTGKKGTGVGEALIKRGIDIVKDKEISKLECELRYLFNKRGSVSWHFDLYMKCGFKQVGPCGVQMFADLNYLSTINYTQNTKIRITGRNNLSLKDLVECTLRAFTSKLEDGSYFSWDPLVSTRKEAREFFESLLDGKKGFSPPECFRVAWIKGEVAGFAGSYILKSKHKPTFGVIGPVGVFPEYRRKGIAYSLIQNVHEILRNYNCKYSYLLTHVDNRPALRLYEKVGFKPVFNLFRFEKKLHNYGV